MTDQPSSADITSDDKLWSALGYPIAIIALIVLLMEEKKSRPFVKYHAIQALVLNVILVIVMVLLSITVVGLFCVPLLWLITFWPAFDSYKGNYTEIPVITNFIKNQGWV
jgi:uncharacterized membrane protein